MQSDSSAAASQQALQGSALRRTCLSGAASLRSLRLAREMVSSMDDSGHSGAGMSSAMSAIVQTSLRDFFFCIVSRGSGPYNIYLYKLEACWPWRILCFFFSTDAAMLPAAGGPGRLGLRAVSRGSSSRSKALARNEKLRNVEVSSTSKLLMNEPNTQHTAGAG
jgi:hypothetical protein